MDVRMMGAVLAVLMLCGPAYGLTLDEARKITPSEMIQTIKTQNIAGIETVLSQLKPDEMNTFLSILRETLELGDTIYTDNDREKIQRIAFVYDKEGRLLDAILGKHRCNSKEGLSDPALDCKSRVDGAAYANFARTVARDACWKTLKLTRPKPKEFSEGVREYYIRQERPGDGGLSQCTEPPEPARCKIGWCTVFYEEGISFGPLTDLGVALPLGLPKFGFQKGQSSSIQATAGIMARAFVQAGRLDLRLGAGITNAVTKEGDGAAGLAWTIQVGFFQVLGVGFLFITNPKNEDTGAAVAFSIDLSGIKDLIGTK